MVIKYTYVSLHLVDDEMNNIHEVCKLVNKCV